jgi:hypothetical protein
MRCSVGLLPGGDMGIRPSCEWRYGNIEGAKYSADGRGGNLEGPPGRTVGFSREILEKANGVQRYIYRRFGETQPHSNYQNTTAQPHTHYSKTRLTTLVHLHTHHFEMSGTTTRASTAAQSRPSQSQVSTGQAPSTVNAASTKGEKSKKVFTASPFDTPRPQTGNQSKNSQSRQEYRQKVWDEIGRKIEKAMNDDSDAE